MNVKKKNFIAGKKSFCVFEGAPLINCSGNCIIKQVTLSNLVIFLNDLFLS